MDESALVNVAVFGAAGRMGRVLLQMRNAVDSVKVVGGVLRPQDPFIGQDASRILGGDDLGIPLVSHLNQLIEAQVVVDFSRPEMMRDLLTWCVQNKRALVTGTTGFNAAQMAELEHAAQKIPIVHSYNMSPGVNLCFDLVEDMARRLGDRVDVEIIEAHHKHKIDAPSGTALRLGESIARAWGVSLDERAVYTRQGQIGERVAGTIGFATVRAGDIIGDHTVMFVSHGERIELTHRSSSRAHYARGAFLAAKWVYCQQPGLYSMSDVLN